MIRILIPVLLLISMDAAAAVRRLSSDCTLPSYTPTESQPFDLDACVLQNGDDVTQLFADIAERWNAFYVRAPSKSVSVLSDSFQWSIRNFVFLEDQNASNRLTITHEPSAGVSATMNIPALGTTYKKPMLWSFANYAYVKVGGPSLSMTFVGTHPGLGTGDFLDTPYASPTPKAVENIGLITVAITDGSSPDLFDWRANIRYSERYAIYFGSSYPQNAYTGDSWRAKQVNIAGLFYATSGVFVHYGVKNLWYDPDRTTFSDPYVRALGWNGDHTSTVGTRKVGTYSANRMQYRLSGGSGYNVDSITGGVKFEYGAWNFIPRLGGSIGSSAQPFVIRLKDWYVSGPNDRGYPAGVTTAPGFQTILFKGDPAKSWGNTQPIRFIRWIKEPSTYGDGAYDQTNNLIRVEANDFENIENFGYDMEFSGDWNTGFWRGDIFMFEYSTDPGSRTWGHVLRAAANMAFTDRTSLFDTNTVTGPGQFSDLRVTTAANVTSRGNVIRDTNVVGTVTIDSSTGTTTITNVNFKGSARTIITVAAGASSVVDRLCAPAGSTITGSGALIYNGVSVALPFTISAATACSLSGLSVPMPPEPIVVE